MEDGTKVTFKNGNTVYKAYRADDRGWRYVYTLVSITTGRKRYKVRSEDIRIYVPEDVAPVLTTRGRVRRPKSFRKLQELSGSQRHTYIHKKWVYKLERRGCSITGYSRNAVEAARYALQTGMTVPEARPKFGDRNVEEAEYYSDVPIAECYLLPDGILMMERVRPVYNLNCQAGGDILSVEEAKNLGYKTPKWAGKVDCTQIGYNHRDELVAYDL